MLGRHPHHQGLACCSCPVRNRDALGGQFLFETLSKGQDMFPVMGEGQGRVRLDGLIEIPQGIVFLPEMVGRQRHEIEIFSRSCRLMPVKISENIERGFRVALVIERESFFKRGLRKSGTREANGKR